MSGASDSCLHLWTQLKKKPGVWGHTSRVWGGHGEGGGGGGVRQVVHGLEYSKMVEGECRHPHVLTDLVSAGTHMYLQI